MGDVFAHSAARCGHESKFSADSEIHGVALAMLAVGFHLLKPCAVFGTNDTMGPCCRKAAVVVFHTSLLNGTRHEHINRSRSWLDCFEATGRPGGRGHRRGPEPG